MVFSVVWIARPCGVTPPEPGRVTKPRIRLRTDARLGLLPVGIDFTQFDWTVLAV